MSISKILLMRHDAQVGNFVTPKKNCGKMSTMGKYDIRLEFKNVILSYNLVYFITEISYIVKLNQLEMFLVQQ